MLFMCPPRRPLVALVVPLDAVLVPEELVWQLTGIHSADMAKTLQSVVLDFFSSTDVCTLSKLSCCNGNHENWVEFTSLNHEVLSPYLLISLLLSFFYLVLPVVNTIIVGEEKAKGPCYTEKTQYFPTRKMDNCMPLPSPFQRIQIQLK